MRAPHCLLGACVLAMACGGGGGGPQPPPGSAPAITSQPADAVRQVGQTATFQVAATGTAPLAYQWRRNGTPLPGANAEAYLTGLLTAGDDGALFSVLVANAYGSLASREALLRVTPAGSAPAIATQPADATRAVGQTATFQVAVTGTPPFTYQWRRNGSATGLVNASAESYTTPALALADDGALFSVVVANSHGSATSREALLRVTAAGACPKLPAATGFAVLQPPPLAEPAARSTYTDPVFGSCVTRVTDRAHDLSGGDTSAGLKNEYSRVQAFNADESRLLIRSIDAGWYVYDARTLLPLRRLPFDGSVDPRWHATDPNLLHYNDGTRFLRCDVRSGEPVLVRDFASDFPGAAFVWTRWEGSPSADGRWWGFMAQDGGGRILAFLVYDLQTNTITARRDLASYPDADSVTISPSGNYFLVQADYCATGAGTDAQPCGLMVYDKNLQNGRGLLRIVGHSDLAYDTQGREVLVYQDNDTDNISMVDLATGQVTALWPIDFSHTALGLHFSGRALQRPGWALVSTHDADTASHTWMDDSLFAVELKANGRVLRLAHTRSLVDAAQEHDYWAEPQASVNRSFTRILFTSNWGRSGTGATECFLVELPADWTAALPIPPRSRRSPAPR